MADLANPCVLVCMGLNIGFICLVALTASVFVLTNHCLNFGFSMLLLVKFSNIIDRCSFIVFMFDSFKAHEKDKYRWPYTRKSPVFKTASICALSCAVISVLQAGVANWSTLKTCARRTFRSSFSLATRQTNRYCSEFYCPLFCQ